MKSYRELKRANDILTFEAMAISERNKSLIKLEAAKKAQARKEILQNGNLKIQPDKQGKHLIDHKNYIPSDKKSVLAHPNPQRLVDEFAGKGMKATGLPPGAPGYLEVVNFGEFIGYAIDRDTGEKIATSWGKIHYAKDGVHIVPTKPR
jgi:cell wall assembly regulator SMI1